MRSHLLRGQGRPPPLAPRSPTGWSTTSGTPRSTSTSWTRWIAGCACSAATAGRRRRSVTLTTCRSRRATSPPRSAPISAAGGEDPDGWRVTLVTNLRVLGYVFNPASFYLCRDARRRAARRGGRGPQHLRRAPPVHAPARVTAAASRADRSRRGMDKAFFVSPFISLEGRYACTCGRAWPGSGWRSTCARPARRCSAPAWCCGGCD